jgi:hypothetical protein
MSGLQKRISDLQGLVGGAAGRLPFMTLIIFG